MIKQKSLTKTFDVVLLIQGLKTLEEEITCIKYKGFRHTRFDRSILEARAIKLTISARKWIAITLDPCYCVNLPSKPAHCSEVKKAHDGEDHS